MKLKMAIPGISLPLFRTTHRLQLGSLQVGSGGTPVTSFRIDDELSLVVSTAAASYQFEPVPLPVVPESGAYVAQSLAWDAPAAMSNRGQSVAVSANGKVVAIGTPMTGSGSTGQGFVQIYRWDGDEETFAFAERITKSGSKDFGGSVALSRTGTHLAVGGLTSVNPATSTATGGVWVFRSVDAGAFAQLGDPVYGTQDNERFGVSVALSDSGAKLAVGSSEYNPGSVPLAGRVRVYDLADDEYVLDYEKVGARERGQLGFSVSVSGDGTAVAAGSPVQSTEVADKKGRVYVYDSGEPRTVYESAVDNDHFGFAVKLSRSGTRIAVGAPYALSQKGTVRVLDWAADEWTTTGSVVEGTTLAQLGYSVGMSESGDAFVAGGPFHSTERGRARVYVWNDSDWSRLNATTDFDGTVANQSRGVAVGIAKTNRRGLVAVIGENSAANTASCAATVQRYVLA